MQSLFGRNPRGRKQAKFVGICALTLASTAAFLPLTQPAQAVGSSSNWLGYINEYRAESGLRPVAHNRAWDTGTYNHSCYINRNGITHNEVPGKPGYTTSGAEAGVNSNVAGTYLSLGSRLADERDAIDGWMNAPYHAIGLLRPGWKSTSLGLCYASGAPRRFSSTLDVIRGLVYAPKQSVVFPGRGATTHLYRFEGESPNPTADCRRSGSSWGLPLIAMFPQPATNATATVRGPSGTWTNSQLCVLDYQDVSSPVAKQILQGSNAVLVIPPAYLSNGTYNISVSGGGQSTNWSFTVRKPGSPAPTTTTTTTAPRVTTTTAPRVTTTTAPRVTTTTAPRVTTTTAPRVTTTTAPRVTTTTAPRVTTTTTTAPRVTTTTIATQPPMALFTPGQNQYIEAGQRLSFNGYASRDPDGGRLQFAWRTTGMSGIVSRGNNFARTFDQPGTYGVELIVTDDEGQVAKKRIEVFVTRYEAPVPLFTPDTEQVIKVGTTLSFDGGASRDPDGGNLTYEWRSTGMSGIASTSTRFVRKFDTPGRTGVELTVIDDEGVIAKKHVNFWVVEPQPPIATFTPGTERKLRAGQSLTFDGSGSQDPDGGNLTYEWRSTGMSGIVSQSTGFSRRFDTPGRTGVELTVIDDEGQVAKHHINVWVS